jgi:hypothetical protein
VDSPLVSLEAEASTERISLAAGLERGVGPEVQPTPDEHVVPGAARGAAVVDDVAVVVVAAVAAAAAAAAVAVAAGAVVAGTEAAAALRRYLTADRGRHHCAALPPSWIGADHASCDGCF